MRENHHQDHHHSKQDDCAKQENCEVQAIQQVPLADENTHCSCGTYKCSNKD